MRDFRFSVMMTGLCLALATGAAIAENKPAAETQAATANQSAVTDKTATATQSAENNTAATKPAATTDLQLTETQKQKLGAWRELQRQFTLNTMKNQEIIEDLVATAPYDQQKIDATAKQMGDAVSKYYEQYALKNREFFDSLTPEQKVKLAELRKQRKAAMKDRMDQIQQSR